MVKSESLRGGTTKQSTKYTYDASNRRASKIFADYATSYAYSGWNVVEEYTGDRVSQQYINGDGVDASVAFIHKGQKYFYHKDRLGNIIAITDSEGKVRERYDYDEYGQMNIYDERGIQTTRSYFDNPITYTGQRYDNESSLYYYKNRYYSASLGRFLTKDPLGMIDSPNLYSYVTSDPLNYIDPMGTKISMPTSWDDVEDTLIDDPVDYIAGYGEIPGPILGNEPVNSGQSAGDCPKKMKLSQKGIDFLKNFESKVMDNGKHVIYDDDTGKPVANWADLKGYATIGYGHLITSEEEFNKYKNGIDEETSEKLFKENYQTYERAVSNLVNVQLTQSQYDSLVSLAFNIGIGPTGFEGSKILEKVNSGKIEEVTLEDFTSWKKSKGKVMQGLINRRKDEYEMFTKGDYVRGH